MPSAAWRTRANALTGLRLLCAPALVWAVASHMPLLAAAIFWLAVATDLADGWAARRYGESSALGQTIDHAVDAFFVSLGTAALARIAVLPALLPPLIALAFLQYAIDSRWLPAAAQGPRPSALGRWNGIGYYAALGVPLTRDALGLGWPASWAVAAFGWLLVFSTLVSIADRLWLVARARSAALG